MLTRACAASSGIRSSECTSWANSARTAAWYPEPVPTSRTRSCPRRCSSAQMRATMYGCEIVWSAPIGSAASSYARSRNSSGTNSSRGTRAIASSTRSSSIPRARSWCSTMAFRLEAVSDNTLKRLRVRGSLDAKVRQHRRHHVGDARGRGIDADRKQRHHGVALDERTVAATACVVAPAEVGELPARRRGYEQLAGVRIRERRPGAMHRVRMVEQRGVTGRLPVIGAWTEAQLLAGATCDGVVVLAAKRHLDRRLAVELAGEPCCVDAGVRKQIDLPRPVRARDDDVVDEIRERQLELRRSFHGRLPVVRQDDDGVPLEKCVGAPRRADERLDGIVGSGEGDALRTFGAVRMRRVVEVREVIGEEVEAVARDEPA